MTHNQDRARAWASRIAPPLALLNAVVLCGGAGLAFFAAIAGVLTSEIPARRALMFGLLGCAFLAGAGFQLLIRRLARRRSQAQSHAPGSAST